MVPHPDVLLNMLRTIDEKIDAVWEEARKTNGRVNGHDTAIALLQSQLTDGSRRRERWLGWLAGFASAAGIVVLTALIR